jgi:hypothetical protein
MKNIPDELYKKVIKLSDEVKKNLRSKGVVVPVRNRDGSISVGTYTIAKQEGYYIIKDHHDDIIVDSINLPQAAAVLANGLALGRFKDLTVLNADRYYGYALFDEQLHNRAVERSTKKSLEYFDVMLTKAMIAKAKKDKYKQDIVRSFEKLIKLV